MMAYELFVDIVFFFKQKTAYEMRISDWSSDVCSSDLFGLQMIRANRPVRSRIYLAKIHPTYVSRCLSPRTAIYMRRTATLSPRNPSSNEILLRVCLESHG